MNITEIKIGTLIEIYIRRDGYNYKVVSKVEYVDETRIGVSPIASRTRLFKFKASDIVDIVYRVEAKSWKWSRVRAGTATLKDGTKLHVFVPTEAAEKFNRRTTYRLPMSMNIEMTYEVIELKSLPDERKSNYNDKTPELTLDRTLAEIAESYRECRCEAYLKDLSEGGASINAAVELKKGDIVSFSLPYGEEEVTCRAIVIRKTVNKENDKIFNYGLSYIETSSNYVAFFFSEQRRMLSENKMDYEF